MFFVTTVPCNNLKIYSDLPPRCHGFFSSLTEAELSLEQIYGDLQEDPIYDRAVIEQAQPGMYPDLTKISWWKFDKGHWKRIAEPEEYLTSTRFALGY